jgi:hypothetical protein
VFGVDGNPAPNVGVRLLARDQGIQQAQTDASGHFVFEGLGLGPVSIMVGSAGGVGGWGGDTNLVIRMQPPNSPANPVRRNIASVPVTTSGTVLDPSGAAAPSVFLSVGPSFGTNNLIQSDADGKYTLHWTTVPFDGIVNASLFARDLEHDWAAVAPMDATTSHLDLHLQPGLTLSGAVRDADGWPVANASVLILLSHPDSGSVWQQLPPTNADTRGLFSMSALARGSAYTLDVAAPGYGSNSVKVPAAGTQTNRLQLTSIVLNLANRQVAGRVIGQDGKPSWGAQVTVRGEGQPGSSSARADSNGFFAVKNICAGPVEVRAALPAGMNQGRTVVGMVSASGGDTNIVVKLGQQNGLPASFQTDQGPIPANHPPPTLQP